jgi:dolichyl-phosphate beta-glucosyltransferase
MQKPYLSVVIPAYKEENNIKAGVLSEVFDYLRTQDYTWEALLVDDGSTDKTLELLKSFSKNHKNFTAISVPHRGKAGTVIAGMLKAQGKIIMFTDMDQATPLNQIEKFFPKFNEGFDIVIGSRKGREGYSFIRLAMTYGFIILRNLILGLPYKDTQCGFKAFKKETAIEIFKRMKIFSEETGEQGASVTAGFDLELLYIARKLGKKVSEVNVSWHDKGLRHEVNPIKDSWEGLRDLFRVRVNAIMGMYRV